MKMSLGELRGVYLYLRVRANASHRYAMDEAVYTAVKVAGETQDPTACDRWRRIVDEILPGVPAEIRGEESVEVLDNGESEHECFEPGEAGNGICYGDGWFRCKECYRWFAGED